MVKAKLGFFQVQIERMLRYTVKLRQASFRIAPKGLDAIDMPIAIRKFILAMVYPKVFVKTNINQAIISTPTIGVNHGVRFDTPSANALQRGSGAIWHDFRIYLTMAFKQPKHYGFTIGTSSTLTSDTLSTKVGFIHFYRTLQWRVLFTRFCQSLTNLEIDRIHGSYRNADQFSGTTRGKIQRKTAHKLPEFSFCNSRTLVISIFTNHLKKLSYVNVCLTS